MSTKLYSKAAFPAKIFLLILLLAIAAVARKEQYGFEKLQKNRTSAANLAPPAKLPFPAVSSSDLAGKLVQ